MIAQTNQAVVNDVTVTVKNVLIGKRQLTQRVFKQIQEEDIINLKTGELEGTPLGFVNYQVSEHFDNKTSKQFLWVNKQQQLRRFVVNLDYYQAIYNHLHNGLLKSKICKLGFYKSRNWVDVMFKDIITMLYKRKNEVIDINRDIYLQILYDNRYDMEYHVFSFADENNITCNDREIYPCPEEILNKVNNIIAEIKPEYDILFENFKKINNHLDYLWRLDQLYIAL